jgi:tetratricopeptide (TPR) repeat protein
MTATTRSHSSAFPDASYNELIAMSLQKNGKYEEAIEWYKKCLSSDSKFRLDLFGKSIEMNLAKAYESIGRYDEALQHYAKGNECFEITPCIRLLIKVGKYKEALSVCEKAIEVYNGYSKENNYYRVFPPYAQLLQLAAEAKIAMHQDNEALADLEKAALLFAEDDSSSLKECLEKADSIVRSNPDFKKVVIKPTDLPRQEQEKIFQLLDYVCSAKDHLNLKRINEITGATMRIPGGAFPNSDQQDMVNLAIHQISFRKEDFKTCNQLLSVRMWRKNCAIDKAAIMSKMPMHQRVTRPVLHLFGPGKENNIEAFDLPSGLLVLHFEKSGFQVLTEIEWRGQKQGSSNALKEVREFRDAMDNAIELKDKSSAYKLASAAISLNRKKSNEVCADYYLAQIYTERSELYEKDGKTDLAILDLKSAFTLEDYMNFPKLSALHIKNGKLTRAIEEAELAISKSKFAREKTYLKLHLARLYVQAKNYDKAINLADECIESESSSNYAQEDRLPPFMNKPFVEYERMIAPALLVKAQAEYGLGQKEKAIEDGEKSSKLFFELAHIECRDKIDRWLTEIRKN